MPARPLLRSACLLALALASGSAAALGLGQIQVKSGLGEPLVAEIPVISSDPAELQQLQAALASPETFTRIGLEPPIGVVADLRFSTSADANGRPVIRVTTTQPVTEPLLTFLVEVDWGQGRLVREYSALVATPNSVAAQPAAPVQMPQVQSAPIVERPQAVAPTPVASAPRPQQSTPTPAPAPPPRPAASVDAGDEVRVRTGDTLSAIAARVAPDDITAEQTMVGLLQANPQAFIGGNMNQLRSGSVLRVPAAAELEAVEAREAASLVRGYARQWRQARSQPQQAVASTPALTPPRAATATPAPSGGRLDIVPPGSGTARSGTRSGIAAAGEGEMLRQELQQTQETLAARDAELQELKSRVADLERLQGDQQKLIALKDAELNAAQQRAGLATPVATTPDASDGGSMGALPWVVGAALVLLGLFAAAWNRRRRAASPAFRAPSNARPSVAAAFAPSAADASAPDAVPAASEPAAAPAPAPTATQRPPALAPAGVPSWERGSPSGRRRTASRAPAADAAWASTDAVDTLAPQVEPANAERLELAQAYLDMGDTGRARELLAEVDGTSDETARDVASRMRQGIE